MKTKLFLKFSSCLPRTGALVLAVICISMQAHAGPLLSPVGPDTPNPDNQAISCGYLKVFSATEASDSINNGDVNFYPHSTYWIYNTAGKRIKTGTESWDFSGEGPGYGGSGTRHLYRESVL